MLAILHSLKRSFYSGPESLGDMPLVRFMPYKTVTYSALYWGLYYLQKHFTLAGVLMFGSSFFVLSYSSYSYDSLALTYLAYCGFGLLLVNVFVGLVFRPRIKLDRFLPNEVHVGEEVQVSYTLKNERSLPAFDLCVDSFYHPGLTSVGEKPLCARLDAGETMRLKSQVQFLLRGIYRVPDESIDSGFPFNLMKWSYTGKRGSAIKVLPKVFPVSYLHLPEAMEARIKGAHQSQAHNNGMEFQACRPYRPGDNLRHMHWYSYARTGVPIVREFGGEGQAFVSLFFDDSYVRSMHDDFDCWKNDHYEKSISFCAGISAKLSEDGIGVQNLYLGSKSYAFENADARECHVSVLGELSLLEEKRKKVKLDFPESSWEFIENTVGLVMVVMKLNSAIEKMIKTCQDREIPYRVFYISRKEDKLANEDDNITVLPYKSLQEEYFDS